MKSLINLLGIILFATVFIIIFALIMSVPVLLLWNWLVPTIFGLTVINIFQAWGIAVLSALLFKTNKIKIRE